MPQNIQWHTESIEFIFLKCQVLYGWQSGWFLSINSILWLPSQSPKTTFWILGITSSFQDRKK